MTGVCCPFAGFPTDQRNGDKEFVIRRAATNRVLNVLRHWVSKHSQVLLTDHAEPPVYTSMEALIFFW